MRVERHCAVRVLSGRGNSFWVCEKSDGVRVLFLICTGVHAPDDQRVYLVRPLSVPCYCSLSKLTGPRAD